jgi:hypothetical protein
MATKYTKDYVMLLSSRNWFHSAAFYGSKSFLVNENTFFEKISSSSTVPYEPWPPLLQNEGLFWCRYSMNHLMLLTFQK